MLIITCSYSLMSLLNLAPNGSFSAVSFSHSAYRLGCKSHLRAGSILQGCFQNDPAVHEYIVHSGVQSLFWILTTSENLKQQEAGLECVGLALIPIYSNLV